MSDVVVQASFNSGEWSPKLFSRVDLAKYKSGAALLENFFVDYRGGASTRTGTKWIMQTYKTGARLINFQASFNVGYIIELGDQYMRFYYQGSPILETGIAITAITKANPCVVTVPGHSYSVGDWVYISGVLGMTQINAAYYKITAVAGNNITLAYLDGSAVNSTTWGTWTSGGTTKRIYTITSPYKVTDNLRLVKFAQSVNRMILCHPSYPAYSLTLVTATNWTLAAITVGSTVIAPIGVAVSTTAPPVVGEVPINYSYTVTAIDAGGQESSMATPTSLTARNIKIVPMSNKVSWSSVLNATAYNIYEATASYFGVVPSGVQYGFIGTCTGTEFIDTNIAADFTQTPPISKNPFIGTGIDHVTVTAPGAYTTVPSVTFSGSPTVLATAIAQLQVQGTPAITAGGAGYVVGDTIQFSGGFVVQVSTVAAGVITGWVVTNPGAVTSGSTPANPNAQVLTSGIGVGATATATWGVGAVIITGAGAGFSVAPTVIFSSGAAAATAYLSATSNGFPTVPGFFQQRLVLAGLVGAPQSFFLSKPGQYFNFDISRPSQATDSISGTIVSGVLNSIKAIVSASSGMLVLTDKASWVVNGGQAGSAITPSAIVANPQSWVGASDVPPIVTNYDILYVQSKGSAIRDLSYNIYFNTFTGTDISTIASHLFYGYDVQEWCWAEQPFYLVQAIRSDGVMLSLTFLKEQDFVGWSHYVTNGSFKSTATVTEVTSTAGTVDAVYTIVERTMGGETAQHIERFAERSFPNGVADAWTVDAGLQYDGAPATNFSGARHLAGTVVTGLADGVVIPPFTVSADGTFTLSTPASKVTIGLGFTCKLQTLGIDIGDPSIQGKLKKITGVNLRVADTLGLKIGPDFDHLVAINDLVVGKVSGMATGLQSQIVTGLVTGNAFSALAPTYTVPGQYCIAQTDPLPATITGLFPEIVLGDDR
jgi:hypothetical protein